MRRQLFFGSFFSWILARLTKIQKSQIPKEFAFEIVAWLLPGQLSIVDWPKLYRIACVRHCFLDLACERNLNSKIFDFLKSCSGLNPWLARGGSWLLRRMPKNGNPPSLGLDALVVCWWPGHMIRTSSRCLINDLRSRSQDFGQQLFGALDEVIEVITGELMTSMTS